MQAKPGEPLDVLESGGQEALLAHILDAEHASKAQAVILFGLREGSLNVLLAPGVKPTPLIGLRK